MDLVESSTIERKYLKPFFMGWEKGPQISQWIKSKVKMDIWLKYGKGSHFSLAMGQTRQSLLLWKWSTLGMMDCKAINLLLDTWPSLISTNMA